VKLIARSLIVARLILPLFLASPLLPPVAAPRPTSALQGEEIALQHFVCNTGYTVEACRKDLDVLRKALANYPVAQLGNWTWILVRSEDWKAILLPRGLDPDSPAFTYYPKRETFIEEALVTQVPGRGRELLLMWNMSTRDLLDLAIRHELGHALCNDANERNADRVARLLAQNKMIICEAMPRLKLDRHE